MKALARLHARCGDFWWYAALLFLACRSGDIVQAFTGLWLVPHYVGPQELGAALPLIQTAGMVGLPLTILAIPFSRWLTLYLARGELGKVKRLLMVGFISAVAVFALTVVMAHFLLPLVFERLRIAEGSLGILILAAGLAGPLSSVFGNALQGLKRFRAMALINAAGAPFRLAVMLVAMPFRALSGYLLGQCAAPALVVGVSCLSLKDSLGGDVESVPLGRRDVTAMVRYTIPIAVYMSVSIFMATWQSLLFRQRLPEIESAAFYMISRLAEVAMYAGMTLGVVAFPLAAEARAKGVEAKGLFARLILGTLVPGLAVTALFALLGGWILGLVPLWSPYVPYSGLLTVYTLRMALLAVAGAFVNYEMAMGRFSFLLYYAPYLAFETLSLVALTGAEAFRGILPDAAVDWMAGLGAARLDFFVWWLFACTAAVVAAGSVHVFIRWRSKHVQAA